MRRNRQIDQLKAAAGKANDGNRGVQPLHGIGNKNNKKLLVAGAGETGQLDAQLQIVQPKAEPKEDLEILEVVFASKKMVSKVNGEEQQQPQDNQTTSMALTLEKKKQLKTADEANNNIGGENPHVNDDDTAVGTNNSNLLALAADICQMDAQLQTVQPKAEPDQPVEDLKILGIMPAPKKKMVSNVNGEDQQQQPQDKPTTSTANTLGKEKTQQPAGILEDGLALGGGQKQNKPATSTEKATAGQLISFAHSSNLTTHMRTHSGEKPFECKRCGERFTRSNRLKHHLKACKPATTDERQGLDENAEMDDLE